MTVDGSVLTRARGIAGFGLTTPKSLGAPPTDEEWLKLLGAIRSHKLCGLAIAAVEHGALQVSDQRRIELLHIQRAMMVHVLHIEKKLCHLGLTFDESGIDFVVLKGPAFANALYPDSAWRPFSDLDLMVGRTNWRNACSALATEGYVRVIPEPHEGFDERFGKAAAHRGEDGFEIDLHRTLVLGPFGLWLDPHELLDHTRSVWIGGRRFQRLDDTASLVNACLHAALGARPPFLLALRDVMQIAQSGDVDWDRLAGWNRKWRLTAALRYAFETASQMLTVPIPNEAAAITSTRVRRSEARALQSYITEARGRGGMALSTLKAIPGLRAKAAYIFCLLVPNEEFLRARANGKSTSLLQRWKVPLRWLRGRPPRPRTHSTRIEERSP
jgi:hypothetical protein